MSIFLKIDDPVEFSSTPFQSWQEEFSGDITVCIKAALINIFILAVNQMAACLWKLSHAVTDTKTNTRTPISLQLCGGFSTFKRNVLVLQTPI